MSCLAGDAPYIHVACDDCDIRGPRACRALTCQNREYPAASMTPLIALTEAAMLRARERARRPRE